MKVKVWGPNLPADMQAKGDLHVHTADCADNRRYRGEDGWVIDVESYAEVVRDCYPPGDFNYDPGEWRDYASDVWLAPCISIPDEPDAIEEGDLL